MQPDRQLNELEIDDQWQQSVFDLLLAPILVDHAYRHQIVFCDIGSQLGALIQKQGHADAMVQLPSGKSMSLELKMVRWPGAKQGRPARYHWSDLFLETMSCTVRGHEQPGWMTTSKADYLLWCQCSYDERSLVCWPFPFNKLRKWHERNGTGLAHRYVKNTINGRALWTLGDLASIQKICRELRVVGFRINDEGLVSDLWGKPILKFLREAPA